MFTRQAYAIVTDVTLNQPGTFLISDVGKVISATLDIIFLAGGIGFIVYFTWSGIQWLTSGGDKNQLELARGKMTNASIGLTMIASSWAIVRLIEYLFGIQLTGGLQFPTIY